MVPVYDVVGAMVVATVFSCFNKGEERASSCGDQVGNSIAAISVVSRAEDRCEFVSLHTASGWALGQRGAQIQLVLSVVHINHKPHNPTNED